MLRLARKNGARFDERLLEIEPVVIPKSTRGHALSEDELEFLAACAPEVGARALLLMGTTGFRLNELLQAKREDFDREARTLHIAKPKEGRPKTIPLMDDEVKLLAAQLLEFPSPSRLIFTRPGGTPWAGHFWSDVLVPARERAARDWREENELDADAPTPFDRIDNHRLRHTAITLMLRAGLKVELVAQRVGHNDGGALILRTYRHVRRDELRLALDDLGGSLLEAVAR
jgi:integrase